MDDIWVVYNHVSRKIYALVHEKGLRSVNTGDNPDIRITKFGSYGAETIKTGEDGNIYLMGMIWFAGQPQYRRYT